MRKDFNETSQNKVDSIKYLNFIIQIASGGFGTYLRGPARFGSCPGYKVAMKSKHKSHLKSQVFFFCL